MERRTSSKSHSERAFGRFIYYLTTSLFRESSARPRDLAEVTAWALLPEYRTLVLDIIWTRTTAAQERTWDRAFNEGQQYPEIYEPTEDDTPQDSQRRLNFELSLEYAEARKTYCWRLFNEENPVEDEEEEESRSNPG